MSGETTQERIEDLEVRLSYQDKVLAELDGVVREFAKRVEHLERYVRELRESSATGEIGPADEKPPHY